MPDVRSGTQVPIVSDFNDTRGTPLYVDRTTSRGYILNDLNLVTPLESIATVRPSGGDDTASIQALIDATPVGGAALLTAGTYSITTLTITKAIAFGSVSNIQRTFETSSSANSGVILSQTSGTKAIQITAPSGTLLNGVRLTGFELKPSTDGGGTDGIYFDTPNDVGIFGVVLDRVAVRRFGGIGVRAVSSGTGGIFDVTFRDCNLENWTTSSGSVVDFSLGTAGGSGLCNQIKLYNCYVTSRKAAVYGLSGAPFELYGTIVQDGTIGAYGVDLNGGGMIIGGNIEGAGGAGTVGVRYRGAIGAFLFPGSLSGWGTGIKVGDGTATAAMGAILNPLASNNLTQDIHITAGGSRQRTLILGGVSTVVTNERYSVNGVVMDVVQLPLGIVVPTAALFAGAASLDGMVIIEDPGAGVGNLVSYKGGQRFRHAGVLF